MEIGQDQYANERASSFFHIHTDVGIATKALHLIGKQSI
jgi:hypothetical protein